MQLERLRESHVGDAAALVLRQYADERSAVPALPDIGGDIGMFARRISEFANGSVDLPAFAAVERGKLLGFLAGYPAERFFSSRSGVYVPLYGNAAVGDDARLVIQRLYAEASSAWVREGRLMHTVSVFTHDHAAVDAWYWLGFGLRCVDAVRPLGVADVPSASALEVRKATPADAEALYPLHMEHCAYYSGAPLFMPGVELEDGLPEFRQWLTEEDHHLWAAYAAGKPVSYMRVRHGGETFVAYDGGTVNICGAFTAPAARGAGAGALLLRTVLQWAAQNGYARLGVDFESFNATGSRFWMKYFTPFQFSAVRFIDDRILG